MQAVLRLNESGEGAWGSLLVVREFEEKPEDSGLNPEICRQDVSNPNLLLDYMHLQL